MMNFSEPSIRIIAFLAAFAIFAMLEAAAPDRTRTLKRSSRWTGAALMMLVSGGLARLIVPAGLSGAAIFAQARGWGLLNNLDAPVWAAWLVTLAALDLAVWGQHAAMHRIPALWRLHRVHHADPDVDVSTALRFHPVEIALSAVWKVAVVAALGAPPLAAFCFEILLNALAQFNHANMRLPRWLDAPLRLFVVTPAMHRVHHSVDRRESDSNYGFCLSLWDRIFRTYRPRFAKGADSPLGQDDWRNEQDQRIDRLLLQPLLSPGPQPPGA